jgi:hypothetical protein
VFSEFATRHKESLETNRTLDASMQADTPETALALMNASKGLFEKPPLPGLPYREAAFDFDPHAARGYPMHPAGMSSQSLGLPPSSSSGPCLFGAFGYDAPGTYAAGEFGGGMLASAIKCHTME